jgi:hypothetical protein
LVQVSKEQRAERWIYNDQFTFAILLPKFQWYMFDNEIERWNPDAREIPSFLNHLAISDASVIITLLKQFRVWCNPPPPPTNPVKSSMLASEVTQPCDPESQMSINIYHHITYNPSPQPQHKRIYNDMQSSAVHPPSIYHHIYNECQLQTDKLWLGGWLPPT